MQPDSQKKKHTTVWNDCKEQLSGHIVSELLHHLLYMLIVNLSHLHALRLCNKEADLCFAFY